MVLLSKVQVVALHGSDDRQSVSEVFRRIESVVTWMYEYIEKDIAVKGLRMAHDLDGADFVANIPAADVRENVVGEWISPDGISICSNCGKAAPYDVEGDIIMYWPSLNYCPNCGAQMMGGAEDG